MFYDFDWDPNKAKTNLQKHGVSFRLATSVLHDPLALTIYDEDHSESEERWITLGKANNGQTLVVVHTWEAVETVKVRVRMISARKADRDEIRDYENAPR